MGPLAKLLGAPLFGDNSDLLHAGNVRRALRGSARDVIIVTSYAGEAFNVEQNLSARFEKMPRELIGCCPLGGYSGNKWERKH